MKNHPFLRSGLFAAACCALGTIACGDDSDGGYVIDGTGGDLGSGGTVATGGQVATGGTAGASTGGTSTGGAGTSTGGTMESCDVASLEVFARSDTEQVWDDNDFSDVTVDGYCPVLVDVTWPHEEGWEDADPSDANFETTHFTLDSYYSSDLTDKQLNLTIELADDVRGPAATAGGYIVSLVSVSSYDRVVVVDPAGTGGAGGTGGADTGGTGGGDTGGTGGDDTGGTGGGDTGGMCGGGTGGEEGDTGGTGGMDTGGTGGMDAGGTGGMDTGGTGGDSCGPMTVTETGYTEAETSPENRISLRYVGDRATIVFPLPNKTAEEDSYDPTRVIKINVRIYNMFSDDEADMDGEDGTGGAGDTGGTGGDTSTGGEPATGGTDTGGTSTGGTDAGGTDAGGTDAGGTDAGGTGGDDTGGAGGMSSMGPIYDYVTTQFAITNFTITDRTTP